MKKTVKAPKKAAGVLKGVKAGVPDANGVTHTAGELFDMACKHPDKYNFDIKTKTLTKK